MSSSSGRPDSPRIGIIAPSSVVPSVELELGVQVLEKWGFGVDVHPATWSAPHLFYAGTDSERAEAFLEYARDSEHTVLWCARGGSGATRLLPLLRRATQRKVPSQKKLLMGYSDATALLEFVRQRWGWATLHAPMPSLRSFSLLPESEVGPLKEFLKGYLGQGRRASFRPKPEAAWQRKSLEVWVPAGFEGKKRNTLTGPLVGGNLSVLTALLGTLDEPRWSSGSLLFLEEVDEPLYRVDRMLQQLGSSRAFRSVRAVVLGSFLGCYDRAPFVLAQKGAEGQLPGAQADSERVLRDPRPDELKPLRPVFQPEAGLRAVFQDWGQRVKRPVFFGLPVGHGPEFSSLPLGAECRVTAGGVFEIKDWAR